jgi:hypothetical protein
MNDSSVAAVVPRAAQVESSIAHHQHFVPHADFKREIMVRGIFVRDPMIGCFHKFCGFENLRFISSFCFIFSLKFKVNSSIIVFFNVSPDSPVLDKIR